jgi:thiamine biosynthesis lipoprotein
MSDLYIKTVMLMSTCVTIQVVGHGADPQQAAARRTIVDDAFGWFRRVEECCTRFDSQSEVMQLTAQAGVPVRVSALLYEAVQFALAVAEESGGAFDPTVGCSMETRGFNREYRTGNLVRTDVDPAAAISYRDVNLDRDRQTITLTRPLILDLGAVAKGLAIDMAARALAPLENFAIDAGGDVYVAGCNPDGHPWSIGIRHPRRDDELIESVDVSNVAVCTSGDYARRRAGGDGHHIVDPRSGMSPDTLASMTVIAPTAMVADALATAAFVLGPVHGIQLLERQQVDGLAVSPALERYSTRGMFSACKHRDAAAPAALTA